MDRTGRTLAALLAALALQSASGALAEPPARIALDGDVTPRASFEAFARDWMARARERGDQDRANPRLAPGARVQVARYREVGARFETELRATGEPDAPYVGVLRYTESVVQCADLRGTACHVVAKQPVIEMFRLRGRRWVY